MPPPRVQLIVECKAWQSLQTDFRGTDSDAIENRMAQHFACHSHGLLLDERNLVLFLHHLPPGIDLFMDIDLHRADVRTGHVFMQAAHRMHLREGQNFSMPRREERPLSTRIMCISPFLRGARKCDVY